MYQWTKRLQKKCAHSLMRGTKNIKYYMFGSLFMKETTAQLERIFWGRLFATFVLMRRLGLFGFAEKWSSTYNSKLVFVLHTPMKQELEEAWTQCSCIGNVIIILCRFSSHSGILFYLGFWNIILLAIYFTFCIFYLHD